MHVVYCVIVFTKQVLGDLSAELTGHVRACSYQSWNQQLQNWLSPGLTWKWNQTAEPLVENASVTPQTAPSRSVCHTTIVPYLTVFKAYDMRLSWCLAVAVLWSGLDIKEKKKVQEKAGTPAKVEGFMPVEMQRLRVIGHKFYSFSNSTWILSKNYCNIGWSIWEYLCMCH